MELFVLFVIVALLLFGPRRGGRMPGKFAAALGVVFLTWLVMAYAFGWTWSRIIGPVTQP